MESTLVDRKRKRWAVVCSSNNNRSMEGHFVLSREGYQVCSFGTGTAVRMPGPSIDRPNVYPFGTAYDYMYEELSKRDKSLYTQNGCLAMLDRNRKIKLAPEKFQANAEPFDIIISCEEKCFDAIVDDLMCRGGKEHRIAHVINFDIKDNPEEAHIAGQEMLELASMFDAAADLDAEMESILEQFSQRCSNQILYALCYY